MVVTEVHAIDNQITESLKDATLKQYNVNSYLKNASDVLPDESKYPFVFYKIYRDRRIKIRIDSEKDLILMQDSVNMSLRF